MWKPCVQHVIKAKGWNSHKVKGECRVTLETFTLVIWRRTEALIHGGNQRTLLMVRNGTTLTDVSTYQPWETALDCLVKTMSEWDLAVADFEDGPGSRRSSKCITYCNQSSTNVNQYPRTGFTIQRLDSADECTAIRCCAPIEVTALYAW